MLGRLSPRVFTTRKCYEGGVALSWEDRRYKTGAERRNNAKGRLVENQGAPWCLWFLGSCAFRLFARIQINKGNRPIPINNATAQSSTYPKNWKFLIFLSFSPIFSHFHPFSLFSPIFTPPLQEPSSVEAKEPPQYRNQRPSPPLLIFPLCPFVYFFSVHLLLFFTPREANWRNEQEAKNRFPRPSLGDPQLTSHLCCTKRSNGAVSIG